ncbi:hypothetical protein EDD18DRAFT_531714 [Armillaria luteobubalina]|uniref:Uncharacterized protein n=1 Tax=Armillaria luteobubalina TaxID=153913 RepID=A0AA39PYJ4_9AGAR|nr:hypothetical protein EDD18DRAFT_531714 [Armillaria luteobubalina]
MTEKRASAGAKATVKAARKGQGSPKIRLQGKENVLKSRDGFEDDGSNLEGIHEKMQPEWEEAHTVTEELVEGPPTRRGNASLTACPNGNHLWCIGGDFSVTTTRHTSRVSTQIFNVLNLTWISSTTFFDIHQRRMNGGSLCQELVLVLGRYMLW